MCWGSSGLVGIRTRLLAACLLSCGCLAKDVVLPRGCGRAFAWVSLGAAGVLFPFLVVTPCFGWWRVCLEPVVFLCGRDPLGWSVEAPFAAGGLLWPLCCMPLPALLGISISGGASNPMLTWPDLWSFLRSANDWGSFEPGPSTVLCILLSSFLAQALVRGRSNISGSFSGFWWFT